MMKRVICALALAAAVTSLALPAEASDRGRPNRPYPGTDVSVVMNSPGISFSLTYPGAWHAPPADWRPPRRREWVPGHREHSRVWVPGYWVHRDDCDGGRRHEKREGNEHRRSRGGAGPRWR